MLVIGNSAPPLDTQIGLPQCTLAVAMPLAPSTPSDPTGFSKPSTRSAPPLTTDTPAAIARFSPGRTPTASTQPAVPGTPCPPNHPNSFCAPCPAINNPTVRRTSSVAKFLI